MVEVEIIFHLDPLDHSLAEQAVVEQELLMLMRKMEFSLLEVVADPLEIHEYLVMVVPES